jgi:ion channel
MMAAVSMLMVAHLVEIIIWSVFYDLVTWRRKAPTPCISPSSNYTTLGYGDIVPVARWRLLGPMTAIGVLLFGWSTAVIFQILWTTISRAEFRQPD